MRKLALLMVAVALLTLAGPAASQVLQPYHSEVDTVLQRGESLMFYPTTYKPAMSHPAAFWLQLRKHASRRYFPLFLTLAMPTANDTSLTWCTLWTQGQDSSGFLISGALPHIGFEQIDSLLMTHVTYDSVWVSGRASGNLRRNDW